MRSSLRQWLGVVPLAAQWACSPTPKPQAAQPPGPAPTVIEARVQESLKRVASETTPQSCLLAIQQENLLLTSELGSGPVAPYYPYGMVKLVAARYQIDDNTVSLRSSLNVYPELDEAFDRPPPTEWYYTRPTKDPLLPSELVSAVWTGAIPQGPHRLVAELVYTIPVCCYAGCFPKRLARIRLTHAWTASPGTALVLVVRADDNSRNRGLLEPKDPLPDRIKVVVVKNPIPWPQSSDIR